jgi:hypothetical protein
MVTGHMVTGHMMTTATGSNSPWLTALSILWVVVVAGWILLFAVLIGLVVILTVARGRSRRRRLKAAAAPTAAAQDTGVGARMDALRRADPDFDQQLLLEAAQMACLLVFAATSTGDDAPLSQLATEAFWSTPFGRYIRIAARDRRRERARAAKDGSAATRRSWVPLDYLASVPELVDVRLGREQRVCVRVFMSELMAIVRPDAAFLANAGATGSLVSVAASLGSAVVAKMNDAPVDVSWVSGTGRFDLTFVRPAGTRTDPSAVLASRTCTVCGATYRSEFAVACSHCGVERPLPWGLWRLAENTPVE